jgi:hypothetical protein
MERLARSNEDQIAGMQIQKQNLTLNQLRYNISMLFTCHMYFGLQSK